MRQLGEGRFSKDLESNSKSSLGKAPRSELRPLRLVGNKKGELARACCHRRTGGIACLF
jgi:hypothetical protein